MPLVPIMKSWLTALAATSILAQLGNAIIPSPPRHASACTVVSQTIYCYGGNHATSSGEFIPQSDTWSIDVSNTFTVTTPAWTNVSHNNAFKTTPMAFGVMVPLNDGVSFLINGGYTFPFNSSEANQTTIFNTKTKAWTSVNSSDSIQTAQHQAVIGRNGKIWFWGGVSNNATGYYANISYWNALSTLDTGSWEWVGTAGVTNYVVARVGHTMTLINDSFIYVIGGLTAKQGTNLDAPKRQQWNLDWASMQDILVYNTVNGTWESRTATGPAPLPRIYHSATLVVDGNTIIVFGGLVEGASSNTVSSDLYVLDAAKTVWTQKNITDGPGRRAGHSAVQVNNTMFIMFGYDYTFADSADIHALDTINWRWVSEFSANGYPLICSNSSCTPPPPPPLSSGAIAGIAVGAAVAVVGIIALLYFFLRRRKKNPPPPGYEESPTGKFGQQPPMQEDVFPKPLPPQHQWSNQPEESDFNSSGSQADRGSCDGPSQRQQYHSFSGSIGHGSVIGNKPTDATPPNSGPLSTSSEPPHTSGASFSSKPDAAEIPNLTLHLNRSDD